MTGLWRRLAPALVAVALAPWLAGCGYALAGKGSTLPPGIRRIGIPTFQNLSTTPELDRLFTDALRAEFQSRGKFVIVPETTGVDAILSGSIASDTPVVTAFTADTRQALRYAVSVVASAEFKEVNADKPLWSSAALRVTDEYDAPNNVAVGDLASLFAQDQNALERLAKTFAQKLVATILENF
jgi:outer membrane lipopolysaccharide assembly protein LptE/RlpB